VVQEDLVHGRLAWLVGLQWPTTSPSLGHDVKFRRCSPSLSPWGLDAHNRVHVDTNCGQMFKLGFKAFCLRLNVMHGRYGRLRSIRRHLALFLRRHEHHEHPDPLVRLILPRVYRASLHCR